MRSEPITSVTERRLDANEFETWLHDPFKFPGDGEECCGGELPEADPCPRLARALRLVLDEMIYAGDRNRSPSVRRAWTGFIAWLVLMDVPIFADSTIDQLAVMAAVSKPTLLIRLHRLSEVTGIPLRDRKPAEQRQRIADAQRNRHRRRDAA